MSPMTQLRTISSNIAPRDLRKVQVVGTGFIKIPNYLCKTAGQEAGTAKGLAYNGERKYKRE